MKYVTRLLTLLVLVSAGTFLANCGSDDPQPTAEETQLNLLTANVWNISSVTGPNGDKTSDYPGMTLTFSGEYGSPGGQYVYISDATSWPSASAWLAEGNWKFGANVDTDLIMLDYDPDQDMTYTLSNNNNNLEIEFNYTGAGFDNGRVNSVDGTWTFEFTK